MPDMTLCTGKWYPNGDYDYPLVCTRTFLCKRHYLYGLGGREPGPYQSMQDAPAGAENGVCEDFIAAAPSGANRM